MSHLIFTIDTPLSTRDIQEANAVRQLGSQIGFGRMMQLAQQEWENSLAAKGLPAGSAFAYGPCVSFTVPCACGGTSSCDWCCGSGWVTEKVRALQTPFGL